MKESIHAVRELPSLLGCVDYVPAKVITISILKSFTFSCVGKNVVHFCQSPISSTEELVTWKLVCFFFFYALCLADIPCHPCYIVVAGGRGVSRAIL